jgi:hypothetical protein
VGREQGLVGQKLAHICAVGQKAAHICAESKMGARKGLLQYPFLSRLRQKKFEWAPF